MPQELCTLCFDRVNDIYEYRLMCANTQAKTRKLLGLPEKSAKKRKNDEVFGAPPDVCSKKAFYTNFMFVYFQSSNSILGDLEPKPDPDDKKYIPPATTAASTTKKKASIPPANGIVITNYPMVQIASTSNNSSPIGDNDLLVPMLAPKPAANATKRKRAGAAATSTPSTAAAAAAEFGSKAMLAPVLKMPKIEAPECPSVWCRVCRCGFETKNDLE